MIYDFLDWLFSTEKRWWDDLLNAILDVIEVKVYFHDHHDKNHESFDSTV